MLYINDIENQYQKRGRIMNQVKYNLSCQCSYCPVWKNKKLESRFCGREALCEKRDELSLRKKKKTEILFEYI